MHHPNFVERTTNKNVFYCDTELAIEVVMAAECSM